jgi:hypothetical protein
MPDKDAYSDEWYTPPQLVRRLGAFDLDPSAAPPPHPRHAKTNWTKKDGGLDRQWFGRVWLNPPYSEVAVWLEKLIAHGDGIALVNAWTEREWFRRAASRSALVLFPTGRIGFWRKDIQAVESGCIGSALIAFGATNATALRELGCPGVLCKPVISDALRANSQTAKAANLSNE